MGGKFRPAVLAVSALALLGIASPVAVLTGPLAAQQVAAATADAKHESKGGDHDARNAKAATAPAATATSGTPAKDSDATTPSGRASAQPSATQPAAHESTFANGSSHLPVAGQIELSKPRSDQPSERADHAPASSRGRHFGAGDDNDQGAGTATPAGMAASTVSSSGTPPAGTQAASTPAVVKAATNHSGATPTPPPVIVEPPAAPQPNPPIAAQPALTGARLDWILVGVVVTLAAAVVAAVRVATFKGRQPPR